MHEVRGEHTVTGSLSPKRNSHEVLVQLGGVWGNGKIGGRAESLEGELPSEPLASGIQAGPGR